MGLLTASGSQGPARSGLNHDRCPAMHGLVQHVQRYGAQTICACSRPVVLRHHTAQDCGLLVHDASDGRKLGLNPLPLPCSNSQWNQLLDSS